MSSDTLVKTRRASSEDIPAIARLWQFMMDQHRQADARFALSAEAKKEFAKYLTEVFENYLQAVFVATRQEQVVGYAIVAEMDNPAVFKLRRYGFICEISVDTDLLGQGIGQALYERAIRWFKRRDLSVVQLNVSPFNQNGRKFYQDRGFQPFLDILWLDINQAKPSGK